MQMVLVPGPVGHQLSWSTLSLRPATVSADSTPGQTVWVSRQGRPCGLFPTAANAAWQVERSEIRLRCIIVDPAAFPVHVVAVKVILFEVHKHAVGKLLRVLCCLKGPGGPVPLPRNWR